MKTEAGIRTPALGAATIRDGAEDAPGPTCAFRLRIHVKCGVEAGRPFREEPKYVAFNSILPKRLVTTLSRAFRGGRVSGGAL